MKTIIVKEIDGYDIIQAFGDALIDPQATKNKVMGLHEKTNEAKAVEKKAEELNRLWKSRHDAKKAAIEAFDKGDQTNHAKHYYMVEIRDTQIEEINKDMVELLKKKKQKDIEIWKENLVYFEPKSGETVISDNEYERLGAAFLSAQEKGNVIDSTGKEIINLKGVKYVKEGKIITIDKLGQDVDGPLLKDLNQDQLVRMRYQYMTEEDIEAEKTSQINVAAASAANMRSQLEIQGDDKALEKSQAYYNNEVSNIEDKYIQILLEREEDLSK